MQYLINRWKWINVEKDKGISILVSLSINRASYFQIYHELDIDFEVAIFNRSFAADELENEELYLKKDVNISDAKYKLWIEC